MRSIGKLVRSVISFLALVIKFVRSITNGKLVRSVINFLTLVSKSVRSIGVGSGGAAGA